MRIPIYQIDAFAKEQFKGNPAAVCPLESWIEDDLMQKIAGENNLSETAFFVKKGENYELRWFTPKEEVDLCGHATLASAYVIFTYIDKNISNIKFHTKSGILEVSKEEDLLSMVFPARTGNILSDVPEALIKGLGRKPMEVYQSTNYMAIFEKEEDILNLDLTMEEFNKLGTAGIIVTAKGNEVDFVSRYFHPQVGIDEDPVTGSSHCTLVPYWKKKLNKRDFIALQLSQRGGKLYCTDLGDRVKISGEAVPYLEGYITI